MPRFDVNGLADRLQHVPTMEFLMPTGSRIAAAGALALLGGCTVLGGGNAVPARGLVVADEPNAVEAGAAIMADGGNAVDAATATYFALSVTYPVAAGLGGGGLCIVHDANNQKAEAFEFLAREAKQGGAYAIPGNVSGFSHLQNTYGVVPWQRVISPAEGFAAAGFAISSALAARLGSSKDIFRLDATLSAEFLDETGQIKPAGTIVAVPGLARTLSQIREFGPTIFYRGSIGDEIVAYSQGQGGAISSVELASNEPQHNAAASLTIGDEIAYLPPSQLGAGKFAEALLGRLMTAQGRIAETSNPVSSVAAATKSTLDEFGIASLPRDLGATGFAAEDSTGLAVACAVTMNGPFGSGHTASDTGVTLANAPASGPAGLAAAFLTPVVATSGGAVSLVGAGAGGPNGTAGIGLALLRLARGEDITKPGALHSTGIAPYDTVNIIGCQNGFCAAIPDPGAFGMGAAGQQ